MAQKLHDQYGYSYDNLKVLQGGWNTWKEKNAADPTGYPIAVANSSTPKIPDKTAPTVAPGAGDVIAPVVIAPAGTQVP